ncbi:MAG: hypothetical protein EU535_04735 [Promethearchaeota archaeon]|nr:MAG: hypothetical protein EU535_04735 [Candidatus Lokiarchaeota archaeon]
MNNPFFIILVIGYIISLTICIFSSTYISIHYVAYGTKVMTILNLFTMILTGFIYSTLFFISVTVYPSVIVWKLTITIGFIALGINALIYAFLNEYNKIPIFSFLIYTSLLGFIISLLFFLDSIQLINNSSNSFPYLIMEISEVNYIFRIELAFIITIFLIFIGIYYLYFSIKIYINSRNKQLTKWLIVNTLFSCIPIIMLILYIDLRLTIYRELHIFFLWIIYSSAAFMLIKKPEMFLALTNKIYNINIYHKSGILLYSYKFEKEKSITDSDIWGNILIGLNHILSEFIDKKDKIDVMKTGALDIVVNYNIDYGFAVLIITNQKNDVLQKFLDNFTKEFREKYEHELNDIQDLNRIIDISDFKDTKEIIEKNFKIYL